MEWEYVHRALQEVKPDSKVNVGHMRKKWPPVGKGTRLREAHVAAGATGMMNQMCKEVERTRVVAGPIKASVDADFGEQDGGRKAANMHRAWVQKDGTHTHWGQVPVECRKIEP